MKLVFSFHICFSTKIVLEYLTFSHCSLHWIQIHNISEMSRTWQCPVRDRYVIPKILQKKYNWWKLFFIWLENIHFCRIGTSNAKKAVYKNKIPLPNQLLEICLIQDRFRQKAVLKVKKDMEIMLGGFHAQFYWGSYWFYEENLIIW